MRVILSGLFLISAIAHAQTLKHTSLVISKDNGVNVFPFFSSTTKPKIAAAINRVLQIASFNHTNIEKNPEAYVDSEYYTSWNYAVDYSNDRLLYVTTAHFRPKQSMNTPDQTDNAAFWFDTATGDQVFPRQFIVGEGFLRMKQLVAPKMEEAMRKRYADIVKKYPQKNFINSLPNLEENITSMKKDIRDSTKYPYLYNAADRSFTFYAIWTSNQGVEDDGLQAELDNGIQLILAMGDVAPFASASWSYYILHSSNTPPKPDPICHTWCGLIGGKIPVTFTIVDKPIGGTVTGVEVYDNFGGTIILKGNVRGSVYSFDETDDKGTKGGSFEFTSSNGKLTGTWKNGNGTKTMDFKAAIGGTDLP